MAQSIGIYKCTYNFIAETSDDLELHIGDIIKVKKQISDDWLHASNQIQSGQIPVDFVEQVLNKTPDRVGVAVDDFISEHQDDLQLIKGDVIGITKNIDANWCYGFSKTGSGMFPVNFVKEIKFHGDVGTDKNNNAEKANAFNNCDHGEAKVIDSFQAQESDELSITSGDIVLLTKEIDSFWLEGIVNGSTGKFPRMYVDIIKEVPDKLRYKERKEIQNSNPEPQAKALYMFVGTNSDELSFDKGDMITLLERLNKDWLVGKIGNHVGRFPSNYVEILVDLPFSSKPSLSPAEPMAKQTLPEANGFPQNSEKHIHRDNDKTQCHTQNIIINKTSQRSSVHQIPAKPVLPISRWNSIKKTQHAQQSLNSTKHAHTQTNSKSPIKCLLDSPTKTKMISSSIIPAQKKRAAPTAVRSSSLKSTDSRENTSKRKSDEKPRKKETINRLSPDNKTMQHILEPRNVKLPADCAGPKVHPPVQRKPSLRGKKQTPAPPGAHQFEYVEEKIFDMYSKPTQKPKFSQDCKTKPLPPSKSPALVEQNLTTSPAKYTKKSLQSLPKPLAPMPVGKSPTTPNGISKLCPSSLNIQQKQDWESTEKAVSPTSSINQKLFSVSFSKKQSMVGIVENTNNKISNSDTDSSIATFPILSTSSTANDLADKPKGVTRERPKSLYFASASNATPSPEKRSQTLDAVLQRSSSLRTPNRPEIPRSPSENLPYCSSESLSQNSIDLKRIDTEIAELKSKIEAEAHLLAGVETLLDFVSEEKKPDLYSKQNQHNDNIVEMNKNLIDLENQKSYLLASLGKVDDILFRVEELEKQISMYLDNCEQLRLMQDVAIVEELPEIRDSIDFCENMVDTLQDELNGLKEKLSEMGQLSQDDGDTGEDDAEERKRKKQMKVIEELITTEIKYCHDISQLLATMQTLEAMQDETEVDTRVLFGNLPDIVQLSTKLLQQLKDMNLDSQSDTLLESIALSFIHLSSEMKNCYAIYCRNYDDAQVLKEKYEEDPVIWNHIASAIIDGSDSEEGFNIGSFLIKPVQRVLKYPLLLSELHKNQSEEGSVKETLKQALDTVTDVATAINEFKRRKDLVLKYRETEDGLGKRVQKLNWHSVAKKSSRINQKITQFTGLNTQTVDENFNEEERRFRAIEKLIKTILKNIVQFDEEFKENAVFQRQCAESFHQCFDVEDAHEKMISGYHKMLKTTETYTDDMLGLIKTNVTEPLSQLLQLFQAPFRLIQKRHDKCLDYDRAKNKAQRAKDTRERDKITQTEQELQASKNVYTALNSQLLEELPVLNQKSASFVLYCLQNFTEARKRYFTKMFFELDALWQLPFFKKEVDIIDSHQDRIQRASDLLSNLAYVPNANKDILRKNSNSQQQQQLTSQGSVPSTNFFVDLTLNSSTTPKQLEPTLIDLQENEGINAESLLVDISSPSTPSLEFNGNSILVPNKMYETNFKDDSSYTTPTCIVQYDFIAENASEISLDAGTEVKILRKCDKSGNDEWWLVEQGTRKGYIPASFLGEETPTYLPLESKSSGQQRKYHERTPGSFLNTSVRTSQLQSTYDSDSFSYEPEKVNSIFYSSNDMLGNSKLTEIKDEISADVHNAFILEYDFEAINNGELSAKEGQYVTCIAKHDQKGNPEWWLVEYDSQRGYIPRDYLSYVDKSKMC